MGAEGKAAGQMKAGRNMLAGSQITVIGFRQILFLPLRLSEPPAQGGDVSRPENDTPIVRAIKAQIAQLEAAPQTWKPLAAPLASHRLDPKATKDESDRFSYQEFVYFHPFIQDILYPKVPSAGAGASAGAMSASPDSTGGTRIFCRTGLEALELDLLGNHSYRLKIDRLWLYLFEIGVAVAMIELHACPNHPNKAIRTLDDVLRVQNAVRRVYPPYFSIKDMDKAGQPWDDSRDIREYPLRVRLYGAHLNPKPITTDPAAFEQCVNQHRTTPFAPHWAELLAPLRIEGAMQRPVTVANEGEVTGPVTPPAAASDAPLWRQTVDERLPSMTFLSSPEAGQMEHHHWARLGAMDDPGDYAPYSPAFLRETFDKTCFYDRHWHDNARSPAKSWGTRFVMTGYSFVCCGTSDDFLDKLIVHHFSRIYSGMGLLLHLQHATLLSLSGELSSLAKVDAMDLEKHQNRMKALQGRFNQFVQSFWFTNVSNQLQAREMYAQWKGALELDRLYAEVSEQMKDAADYLDSRLQMAQAERALRLNRIATFGVPAAVATGILGMNVLISDKVIPQFETPMVHLAVAMGVIALVVAATWGLVRRFSSGSSVRSAAERDVATLLGIVACFAGAVLMAALIVLSAPENRVAPPAAPACCVPATLPAKP